MAPPQLTPKTLTQPARGTMSDPDLPLWRKNPVSNEPYDPVKCIETERPKNPDTTNRHNNNTFNTLEPQNQTPKQSISTVGIGQKPSPEDPLGIGNLSPANLASLIASTKKNLNKPGGGFHATPTTPKNTAQAGYNVPHDEEDDAVFEDTATEDDPRNQQETVEAQHKASSPHRHHSVSIKLFSF
eukprot:4270840-Pleurochrysis_carterae.AAC.1